MTETAQGLRLLDGFPADVVAVEVIGHVTRADYEERLTPAIERVIASEGKAKVLYVAGKDFAGYSPGAVWEDTVLGLKHFTGFARCAIVTDIDWIVAATRMFAPLMRCPVKIFTLTEFDDAKAWISAARV